MIQPGAAAVAPNTPQLANDLSYCALKCNKDGWLGSIARKVAAIQSFCQSEKFKWFYNQGSVSGANFVAATNEQLEAQFVDAIRHYMNNDEKARIGLVFHGTSFSNILLVLGDGLDSRPRNGQAYGPGGYFSTHPSHSHSYAQGCHHMLVFAAILHPGALESLGQRRRFDN